jgi:glycosyltransferase involved in cell wall biosynthesis
MTDRKRITIVTPCYNEELNVRELHRRMRLVMDALPQYEYRHIFIDNASHDGTVAVLRAMAAEFPEVRVIVPICRSRRNSSLNCSPVGRRVSLLSPPSRPAARNRG